MKPKVDSRPIDGFQKEFYLKKYYAVTANKKWVELKKKG
jgi:hypothetical protein